MRGSCRRGSRRAVLAARDAARGGSRPVAECEQLPRDVSAKWHLAIRLLAEERSQQRCRVLMAIHQIIPFIISAAKWIFIEQRGHFKGERYRTDAYLSRKPNRSANRDQIYLI